MIDESERARKEADAVWEELVNASKSFHRDLNRMKDSGEISEDEARTRSGAYLKALQRIGEKKVEEVYERHGLLAQYRKEKRESRIWGTVVLCIGIYILFCLVQETLRGCSGILR
jgi:hypothetical protein